MSTDLAAKVARIIREVADPDFAAELVIDVVARGLGKLGGRPPREARTEVSEVSEPVTKPPSPSLPPSFLPPLNPPSYAPPFSTLPSVSSEPAEPAPEPPVMAFDVVGNPKIPTWGLTSALLAELAGAFPGLNAKAECERARVWLVANPGKRKTARGMGKFLFAWLERTQNQNGGQQAIRASPMLPRIEVPANWGRAPTLGDRK